ncbi:hypothetical protein [Mycolicibacterium insubricum]|uniref:hypothetical protein n=1 Tax=Mycolicibacterium insubricum TaxID=444597 RepID=UPI0021F34DBF|nr:hypothetical protein [Mycolicibacterium insubricum]
MTAAEERATTRRKDRAGVEDRWHRKPRPDETDADWCTDAKHGKPGTLVCTSRHNSGRRWLARWVHNNNEETASFVRKADAEAKANEVRAEFHIGTYVDKQSSSPRSGRWPRSGSRRCAPSGNSRRLLATVPYLI